MTTKSKEVVVLAAVVAHRRSRRRSKVTSDTKHRPGRAPSRLGFERSHNRIPLPRRGKNRQLSSIDRGHTPRPPGPGPWHVAGEHCRRDPGPLATPPLHQKLSLLLQQKRLPLPSQAPSQAAEAADNRGLLYKSSIDPENQIWRTQPSHTSRRRQS